MSLTAFGFSDAARRCAEAVNMHALAGAYGKWVAIRLSDGGSDGIAYDSKSDAVRHQLHETLCCYISVPLGYMHVGEAEAFMRLNRQLYDNGMRLSDPNGKEAMVPIRWENLL